MQQGVSTNSITATGFANTLPVASNDNSAGRQENRRVELLVSGESIEIGVTVTTGTREGLGCRRKAGSQSRIQNQSLLATGSRESQTREHHARFPAQLERLANLRPPIPKGSH